jgi:hypothetical protein
MSEFLSDIVIMRSGTLVERKLPGVVYIQPKSNLQKSIFLVVCFYGFFFVLIKLYIIKYSYFSKIFFFNVWSSFLLKM